MDIKIIPEKYKMKKEEVRGAKLLRTAFWAKLISRTNLWLILAVGFLVLSLLISFGLWGYRNSLREEKANIEKKFEDLAKQRDLEKEANFMELKSGIENLKKVLKNRLYPSRIFEMFEELTLPYVQFSDFNADFSKAEVGLTAEAVDYSTLSKQIVAFEKDERIEKVDLSGVSLDTSGRVSSDLKIELNPDFLRSE